MLYPYCLQCSLLGTLEFYRVPCAQKLIFQRKRFCLWKLWIYRVQRNKDLAKCTSILLSVGNWKLKKAQKRRFCFTELRWYFATTYYKSFSVPYKGFKQRNHGNILVCESILRTEAKGYYKTLIFRANFNDRSVHFWEHWDFWSSNLTKIGHF